MNLRKFFYYPKRGTFSINGGGIATKTFSTNRKNVFKIPMISERLRSTLFKNQTEPIMDRKLFEKAKRSIVAITKTKDFDKKNNDIAKSDNDIRKIAGSQKVQKSSSNDNEESDFEFPNLHGANISEHFDHIARQLSDGYKRLLLDFADFSYPPMPVEWSRRSGWTMYDRERENSPRPVPYPPDDILVLDVEVCSAVSSHPVIAVALSKSGWYSWCSSRLQPEYLRKTVKNPLDNVLVTCNDLIPVETGLTGSFESIDLPHRHRVIIGHNVGYDRTYLREQYFVQGTKLRFFDTMSAHIAVSGLAGDQRIEYQYHKTGRQTKAYAEATEFDKYKTKETDHQSTAKWVDSTSLNNLLDVHTFYCGRDSMLKLDKEKRDHFVKGSLENVAENFQDLVTYCATDVAATFEVYKELVKLFFDRFPSPVTLCGMLEMSTTFLPVNENWFHYLQSSDETRALEDQRVKKLLMQQCDKACSLLEEKKYESDLWMFDEDWSIQDNVSFVKKATTKSLKAKAKTAKQTNEEEKIRQIWDTCKANLKKNVPFMAGFPMWYRSLCRENGLARKTNIVDGGPVIEHFESWDESEYELDLIDGFEYGPSSITTLKHVTPKLLRLHWRRYPLLYSNRYGWGYLVPAPNNYYDATPNNEPIQLKLFRGSTFCTVKFPMKELLEFVSINEDNVNPQQQHRFEKIPSFENICVHFAKLPHKEGPESNVGNPLAKDFVHYIEENVLASENRAHAHLLAELSKTCSYWKNNSDRIHSLMVIWLDDKLIPKDVLSSRDSLGVILPRLVVAGTVTRRAVEPTWMTVSNAKKDRIGSELKGLIQALHGYSFVGADVDSQEMWIAGLLSDSAKSKIHGSTPFSYMLLKGTKSDKTDQHSVVAQTLGITREQAKVINYGRFYGAGLKYATNLLQQFRPGEEEKMINDLALKLYKYTKGTRCRIYSAPSTENDEISADSDTSRDSRVVWKNGSESDLFNCLEEIASSPKPVTPVLKCMISRSLEPDLVGERFLPSRINWIIQSSAVDFLHALLTCMRWLCDQYHIDARFSLSVHDEVRYLVKEKDKYRAALALQLTNLLTRSFFVYRLGMRDLPDSVAYFSKVDIDKTFRKEVDDDCVTPSNPLGLKTCYNIPKGEGLCMQEILEKTSGTLRPDDVHKK